MKNAFIIHQEYVRKGKHISIEHVCNLHNIEVLHRCQQQADRQGK